MKNHGKSDKKISELVDQTVLEKISHKVVTDLEQLVSAIDVAEVSRLQIFHRLQFFQECGVEFEVLDPHYCQLRFPLDLLDTEKIRAGIPQTVNSQISSIKRHHFAESTNSVLLEQPFEKQHARICLAEYQTAGRGRHGRHWLAPFASGLCVSLGWQFKSPISQLQLISLLPAVALIRVLHKAGLAEASVKWPNDIICKGHKLAGVLIEIPTSTSDQQIVVIGVGVNVYNRSIMSEKILQPWTAINQHLKKPPSRNELVAMLITELFELLQTVEKDGLAKIRNEWRRYDALINTPVTLLNGKNKETGVSRGIGDDGSLCVEINGELRQFVSGEISLRPGN